MEQSDQQLNKKDSRVLKGRGIDEKEDGRVRAGNDPETIILR